MFASFAETVAADADIILATITSCAVVMEFILYVVLATALTCYVWLYVEYRCTQCCSRSLP
jgi:hypothetical protein